MTLYLLTRNLNSEVLIKTYTIHRHNTQTNSLRWTQSLTEVKNRDRETLKYFVAFYLRNAHFISFTKGYYQNLQFFFSSVPVSSFS